MPSFRFTKENAKELSKRGQEAWREKRLREKLRVEKEVEHEEMAAEVLSFQQERLYRVRAQIRRLDQMLSLEKDPLSLDRLARAITQLAEQERLLDGRPLPGSLRPRGRRPGALEPMSEPDQISLPASTLAPGIRQIE